MSKRDQNRIRFRIKSEKYSSTKLYTLKKDIEPYSTKLDKRIVFHNCKSENIPYKFLGKKTCILNFGNYLRPGKTFPNNSITQEDELLRKFPALFRSLNSPNLYPINFDKCEVIVTDYTRRYRGDNYKILKSGMVYSSMFITAPAPDHSHYPFDEYDMLQYIRNMIWAPLVFTKENHPDGTFRPSILVLGGWGCGVFRMSDICFDKYVKPSLSERFTHCVTYVELIGAMFRYVLLDEGMYNYYEKTVMAIPDSEVLMSFGKMFR